MNISAKVTDERVRFDAGMSAFEAARDIELREYSAWSDPERIAVNVDSLYREYGEPRYAPCLEIKKRVEAGWLGRKSGRGFYTYDA